MKINFLDFKVKKFTKKSVETKQILNQISTLRKHTVIRESTTLHRNYGLSQAPFPSLDAHVTPHSVTDIP